MSLPQSNPVNDGSPEFCAGRKVTETPQALLWTFRNDDPTCPSRLVLHVLAETQGQIAVTLRHINRWRKAWGLNRGKGRPRRVGAQKKSEPQGHLVQGTPRLSGVGVHLLAHGLAQHETLGPVVTQRTQAVEAPKPLHPGDDLALVHHRVSTLVRRLQALCVAPLCGIDRLPALDPHEPPLQTRLGRGYHSSTLRQFLGQLERINASEALMPTRLAAQTGQMPSVDGHRIASWSRVPMHTGTITMLGRIMAGSQAVMAHDDAGQALLVAYDPPDIHRSQVIMAYCQRMALATGNSLLVIDRAVNAGAMARAVDDQGLGLLCMLDDHEHQGLDRFEATQVDTLANGTRVSRGPWKGSRPDDPRRFVLVEPAEGQPLVYWATPKVEAVASTSAWPRVYRERNERQAHSFKRMIAHGARDINYGRKRMSGPDRHQHRARATLDQALEATQQRIDTKAEALKAKQDQVAEAESSGHGTRLAQRQRALAVLEKALKDAHHNQDCLAEHAQALGPPGERADRDFRKQTIMTMRTLWLENALKAFMVALLGTFQTQVSLETIVHRLFERGGARMETNSHVVYWVNTAGLSLPYRRLLSEVVDGLCAMDMRDQGKPICVRLKDMPPCGRSRHGQIACPFFGGCQKYVLPSHPPVREAYHDVTPLSTAHGHRCTYPPSERSWRAARNPRVMPGHTVKR
jgi:hypothetical protein